MATYAIGDIQGCRQEFEQLLELVGFGASDTLWLVGDLVNRGDDSAGVMDVVLSLNDQVRMVLGNHDLHMLAIYYGGHNPSRSDTFHDVLQHPRMEEFAAFLCRQSLLYHDPDMGWTMTHAGIPHIWSLQQAIKLSGEVAEILQDRNADVSRLLFFEQMYGNEPDCWADELSGLARIKLITNYFTRMRLIQPDGTLDFMYKGALADKPDGWYPWYELALSEEQIGQLVVGHWAALDGRTTMPHIHAIDTGCVYGRQLTALRLDDKRRFQIQAESIRA